MMAMISEFWRPFVDVAMRLGACQPDTAFTAFGPLRFSCAAILTDSFSVQAKTRP